MTCPILPLKPFTEKPARLEFDPKKENEEAGMTLLNNGSHFDISVALALKPGPVNLRVTGKKSTFTFSYAQGDDAYTDIEVVDSKFLATETVGFFTAYM